MCGAGPEKIAESVLPFVLFHHTVYKAWPYTCCVLGELNIGQVCRKPIGIQLLSDRQIELFQSHFKK